MYGPACLQIMAAAFNCLAKVCRLLEKMKMVLFLKTKTKLFRLIIIFLQGQCTNGNEQGPHLHGATTRC